MPCIERWAANGDRLCRCPLCRRQAIQSIVHSPFAPYMTALPYMAPNGPFNIAPYSTTADTTPGYYDSVPTSTAPYSTTADTTPWYSDSVPTSPAADSAAVDTTAADSAPTGFLDTSPASSADRLQMRSEQQQLQGLARMESGPKAAGAGCKHGSSCAHGCGGKNKGMLNIFMG